ncbi:CsgE family curli-type amyloid fiber assembly protein [Magnetococcales bacterium HHB-1]
MIHLTQKIAIQHHLTYIFLSTLLLLTPLAPSYAAAPEIDGLLLQQTYTPFGYDFYFAFTRKWSPPNVKGYNILIDEIPFRARSSVIRIHINNQLAFQSILSWQRGAGEKLIDQAKQAVNKFFLLHFQKPNNSPDMAGDGF